jgi:hypothetical protein
VGAEDSLDWQLSGRLRELQLAPYPLLADRHAR